MTSYETHLRHRRTSERGIGRHIVEIIERGETTLGDLRDADTGLIRGTDMDAAGLVALSGVARARKANVLQRLRDMGEAFKS